MGLLTAGSFIALLLSLLLLLCLCCLIFALCWRRRKEKEVLIEDEVGRDGIYVYGEEGEFVVLVIRCAGGSL